MHLWTPLLGLLLLLTAGCHGRPAPAEASAPKRSPEATGPQANAFGEYTGFDRNNYPGDATMATMHKTLAFTGYWLTNPPGESSNSWVGKRALLRSQGWGFLVLANGRFDEDILKFRKAGMPPAALGKADGADAVKAARSEGFPAKTILFLDQEEGGRLLDEQAEYLLAWTEAVAASNFVPGVYASGQTVEDGPGQRIDTIQDIRQRVTKGGLHPVAIFDALDQCPPAPGCTVGNAPLSAAPDKDLIAWQYAQSPRRPEITKSCAETYAPDGNCYAPGVGQIFLDLDVAATPDPSHGR